VPELPITEPVETTIEEPEGSLDALSKTTTVADVEAVASEYPTCLAAWARLGTLALDSGNSVQAYAYFRVGYHRGLDRIRQAGWRGSGRIPWSHPPNRGFLESLRGLSEAAGQIGELTEAERCESFFSELAPDAPSA
jgi:hypothetical protein